MILLNRTETKASKVAQTIIWQHVAQWSLRKFQDYGIDEKQLTNEEQSELIEQLEKQEGRVRALFGF